MNPIETFGLNSKTLETIRSILTRNTKIKKAILYGSRAKGNYKPASDIDLALEGSELSLSDLLKIESELDESSIPYRVDLCLIHHIDNQELLDHIKRAGKIFYTRS
jgi:uncharacterized protein